MHTHQRHVKTPCIPSRAASLSSSLRLHLSALLSEEEEAKEPDPLLARMHERVREHCNVFGLAVLKEDDAAEVMQNARPAQELPGTHPTGTGPQGHTLAWHTLASHTPFVASHGKHAGKRCLLFTVL